MLIEGRNLFDLSLVRAAFKGYFMDASGNIFSNKSGKIKPMLGSATASGKYYTLNGQTYSGTSIKNSAVGTRFYAETKATLGAPQVSAPALAGSPTDRSYATSIDNGIKQRGVVICSVVNERLVFGSDPKIHTTAASWKGEIERLARNNPGVKFIALRVDSAVVANGVTWL
jgi:hypothetical protein